MICNDIPWYGCLLRSSSASCRILEFCCHKLEGHLCRCAAPSSHRCAGSGGQWEGSACCCPNGAPECRAEPWEVVGAVAGEAKGQQLPMCEQCFFCSSAPCPLWTLCCLQVSGCHCSGSASQVALTCPLFNQGSWWGTMIWAWKWQPLPWSGHDTSELEYCDLNLALVIVIDWPVSHDWGQEIRLGEEFCLLAKANKSHLAFSRCFTQV